MKHRIILLAVLAWAIVASAADPTATRYTMEQCEGSLTPYPREVRAVQAPDSLVPVFINHVGRHGARYPASAANCLALRRLLNAPTPSAPSPRSAEGWHSSTMRL